MSEERTECICALRLADFEKIPQPFTTTSHSTPSIKLKVGDETKKGIEENREILEQMKKEARTDEWTPND